MIKRFATACLTLSVLNVLPRMYAQSTADIALLEKTRALYDAPLTRGLINFDCAVGFDFEQHLKDTYGAVPESAKSMVSVLQPIRYRVFFDRSGATVTPQAKLPDFEGVAHAGEIEGSNRNLLQAALNSWEPYAAGVVFPVGTTKYQFEKQPMGYQLSMSGPGLAATLRLDQNLLLVSGVVEQPMHIVLTTNFQAGPSGLLLSTASVNANDSGTATFGFSYSQLEGFQIPTFVSATSEQKQTWQYRLTDCKLSHGIVVQVGLPQNP